MKTKPSLWDRVNKLEYKVMLTPYARSLVDSTKGRYDYLDENCPGWRTRTEKPPVHSVIMSTYDGSDDDDE